MDTLTSRGDTWQICLVVAALLHLCVHAGSCGSLPCGGKQGIKLGGTALNHDSEISFMIFCQLHRQVQSDSLLTRSLTLYGICGEALVWMHQSGQHDPPQGTLAGTLPWHSTLYHKLFYSQQSSSRACKLLLSVMPVVVCQINSAE